MRGGGEGGLAGERKSKGGGEREKEREREREGEGEEEGEGEGEGEIRERKSESESERASERASERERMDLGVWACTRSKAMRNRHMKVNTFPLHVSWSAICSLR
jgi:hypothetical protein